MFNRPPIVVFGAGYTGRRIFERTSDRPVIATTRSRETCASLRGGAHPQSAAVVFDPHGSTVPALPDVGSVTVDVVICWPPTTDARADEVALTHSLHRGLGQGVRRAVYLSATSVYGTSSGAVIEADDPVAPDSERGHRRYRHETQFLTLCDDAGVEGVVLRLPGIYGPGRSGAEKILAGTWRLADGGAVFSNRIHVDDIVGAVLCLADAAAITGPYVAVDDHPFQVVELAAFSARALGAPMPDSVPLEELPASVRSFWTGDRRLSNAKLRALGWSPVYASFREGLPQAWTEEGTPFSVADAD